MAFVTHHLPATQVLNVDVLQAGRASVPFLNWRVSAKPIGERNAPREAFQGPGVYGVCFDNHLIYIGTFLGSGGERVDGVKAATFTGDVASGRWWQHFGSVTGRSHSLSAGPRTLEKLSTEFGPDHPLVAALRAGSPDLAQGAGCLGTFERLRFVARHFADFIGEHVLPMDLLERFFYVFVRFDSLPDGIDAHELSRCIEYVETELIECLHPEANGSGRIVGGQPVRIECSAVPEKIEECLRRCLPGIAEPPDQPVNRGRETSSPRSIQAFETTAIANTRATVVAATPAGDAAAERGVDVKPSSSELFLTSQTGQGPTRT